MKTRDFLERLFWTFTVTALANVLGAALLDIEAWKMAAVTGAAAVFDAITIFGRWRLSVLPNPGQGLPGLPTGGDGG